MVGSDGSESAHMAVTHAARLAKMCDARLTVVTAFTPTGEGLPRQIPEELGWKVTDEAEAEARADAGRRLALDEGVLDVRIRAQAGEPAEVLLATSAELEADVVVVGSRGMSPTTRFMLGSVPNKVSHHAPCDVLIVRTTP